MPHPDHPADPLARATAVGGLTLLTALTLAHPSATRMHTGPWAVIATLLWLLPVALLVMALGSERTWRLPNRWITAGIILLSVSALCSAWMSPFSGASLARVWPTLGGAAFFLWLYHWLSEPAETDQAPRRAMLVAQIIAWGGAVLAIASVVGFVWEAMDSTWVLRNTHPFGHSNYVAGAIVLLLPWFVFQVIRSPRFQPVFWLVVPGLAVFALIKTSSRGGVAAIVCGLGLVLVALWFELKWSRQKKLFLAGALGVACFAVVFSNPRLRDLALGRGWSDDARESNLQRTAMLEAGLRLGQQRPLLGWGPGSVPLAYPRVRATLDGGSDNVLQLHNTPAQIWATLGLGGVIAITLLIGGTGIAASRAWRKTGDRPLLLTASSSLLSYAVFALTDHQFDLPVIVALAAGALAVLTAAAGGGGTWRVSPRNGFILLAGFLLLSSGAFWSLGRDVLARQWYADALDAQEHKNIPQFISRLERATQLTPYDPYFQHQLVGTLLEKLATTRDSAAREPLLRDAIARLEASLATHVHEEYAHFNLGWLLLERGEPLRAANHFVATAQLVPNKGGVYFGLGLALQTAGREESATRAFALEWINDPRQLTSPGWEVPALARLRPAVTAEVMRLYQELRQSYPRASEAEMWTRWWLGESISREKLGNGFTSESAHFAAALPSIQRGDPLPTAVAGDRAWALCYAAWRTKNYPPLARGDPSFAAALARRAAKHPADFRAFLRASTEDESSLVRVMFRQRAGYGVLALHPDGPVLGDVYVVQENRVIAEFAPGLFPPKGWLPGRFLLALLPRDVR